MAQPIYKVIFQNQNRVYEVYARQIFQSDMWGFIEIEELVFGERSQLFGRLSANRKVTIGRECEFERLSSPIIQFSTSTVRPGDAIKRDRTSL